MKALGLTLREGIGEKPSSSHKTTKALPVGDESSICGRVNEKETIIESLLSDGTGGIGVICVVGFGGVGKTTLAQLVYNDNKVKEQFDVKAWVYISQEFVMFNIMKSILEVVTPGTCGNVDPNKLQSELEQKLKGKKFLIVMDDVWNDKHEDWYNLLKPLNVGAQGSKIVITTRNASVASATRAILKYDLRELADNDCWDLFAKHAFDDGNADDRLNLEKIGREIVKKCNGLPLAAKAIGSLLRFKSYEEWKKILASQMWNLVSDNILPALKLSYYQLPSHLKRCFAYCAMFPKGYEFSKEFLVILWMAEGFIVQSENDNDIENMGNEYFDGLVSRSFFQMSSGPQPCFIMHDHMHDLAKSISGEFCFMYEDKDSSEASTKTRHLYVRATHPYKITLERLTECQSLHTFVSERLVKKNVEFHTLLPKIKYLRVLSLNYHYEFKLLDSISNMKHLRYLKLQSSSIKRLPESMGSLYNLQILILRDCWRLVELPTNLRRLINLRCLDIRGTILKKMPVQMGKLMKLQTLTNFILGKSSGSGIEELGKLQHIQGELTIENLQNVVGPEHASAANLRAKEKLKKLKFTWARRSKASKHARSTLESLRPHEKVESLSIAGYKGTTFPNWLGYSKFSLSNLVSLKLDECSKCSCLPSLGQLASLKDLSITGLDELVAVGSEFYGSCSPAMKPFGSLITLRFERMGKWCEWKDEDGAFPVLQELYLIRCPKLTTPFPSQLPYLTKLHVAECTKQLVDSIRVAPTIVEMLLKNNYYDLNTVKLNKLLSGLLRLEIIKFESAVSLFEGIQQVDGVSSILEEIKIQHYNALECFPLAFLPMLKKLDIRRCSDFKSLCAYEDAIREQFTYLNSLELWSCPKLVCFPKGGLPAPNLKHLSLIDCSNLKALPECMHSLLPSLVKFDICDCPQLESFPKGGLPSNIESLFIGYCKRLKIKHIGCCNNCEDNESFSEEMLLLPCSLTCLEIRNLQNLESLDFKGFIQLRELVIKECPVFQYMPESMQAFLSCLVKLEITMCPELLESFLKQGLPTSLESVEICNCEKVNGGLMECDLRMLQSLNRLIIDGNDDVEYLPEETLLPSSLTYLDIRNFHNLKYLDLQHLTSLTDLRIWNCRVLQCLPEEGLPSSFAFLYISGCPLLTRCCKRKIGKDKISHIPVKCIY